jgi:hypothetical protein
VATLPNDEATAESGDFAQGRFSGAPRFDT